MRAAANLGILMRQTSESFATELGHQLLYGAAAAYPVDERVDLMLEVFGRSGLNQFAELLLRRQPVRGRHRRAAITINGMWSVTGGRRPRLRQRHRRARPAAVRGAAFDPDFRDRDHDGVFDVNDKCPDEPEDRDGFQDQDGCPDQDNDNDTIPDAKDKCPNEAEDVDQFEDDDGCPEPDNDKDGIPDLNDACPNAPEDDKGKKPTDGCPSTTEDSDGDGVPDASDKCPDEPEDNDGFQDDDGCPDPDNDADGIPDNFDNCPNDAEDPDGFEDEDGCPDPDNDKDGIPDAVGSLPDAARDAERQQGRRRLPRSGRGGRAPRSTTRSSSTSGVGFVSRGGKLHGQGRARVKFVNLVALIMKGHPEIAKVRIEVHAEGVTKEETQKRADAVRDFLVGKGVDTARLTPVGRGRRAVAGRLHHRGGGAKPAAAPGTGARGAEPTPPRRRPPAPARSRSDGAGAGKITSRADANHRLGCNRRRS